MDSYKVCGIVWNLLADISSTLGNVATGLGIFIVLVAAVTTIAKVYVETGKDKLISILQTTKNNLEVDNKHYRQEVHDIRNSSQRKISEAENAVLVALQQLKEVELRNAQLVAKTDLSPVMETMTNFIIEQREFVKKQTEINVEILSGLRKIIHDK